MTKRNAAQQHSYQSKMCQISMEILQCCFVENIRTELNFVSYSMYNLQNMLQRMLPICQIYHFSSSECNYIFQQCSHMQTVVKTCCFFNTCRKMKDRKTSEKMQFKGL